MSEKPKGDSLFPTVDSTPYKDWKPEPNPEGIAYAVECWDWLMKKFEAEEQRADGTQELVEETFAEHVPR